MLPVLWSFIFMIEMMIMKLIHNGFIFNLSSGQWESIKNVKNKVYIMQKIHWPAKIGDNYF